MKKGADVTVVFRSLGASLMRYQTIIFFVLISVLIGIAVFMILRIFITQPENVSQAPAPLISEINKATVSRVNELRSSETVQDIPAPEGRYSPFYESTWDIEIMKL